MDRRMRRRLVNRFEPLVREMVSFLKNGEDSDHHRSHNPTSRRKLARGLDLLQRMKHSVVWIDGGQLYGFKQFDESGPRYLVPWIVSLNNERPP